MFSKEVSLQIYCFWISEGAFSEELALWRWKIGGVKWHYQTSVYAFFMTYYYSKDKKHMWKPSNSVAYASGSYWKEVYVQHCNKTNDF